MKRYIFILALSICLLISAGAYIFSGFWGQAMAEGDEDAAGPGAGGTWAEKWEQAGVFGPSEGLASVIGNASIEAADVTLQNIVINGNLYLQAAIGNHAVTLRNVTVTGEMYILGGGSIDVRDGQIHYLEIKNAANATSVSAEGSASIWSVRVKTEAQLEEKTGPEAPGFGHVYSTTSQTLTLAGNFPTLTVEHTQGAVNYISGRIGKVYMESQADGSVLTLGEQTEVGVLDLISPVRIIGRGIVEKVIVFANGSEMERDARTYEFAEGKSILVSGGVVDASGKHEVILDSITDVVLNPGKTATKKLVVEPSDAAVTVASGNKDVVAIALEGSVVTISALSSGSATITVTAIKEGYSTATQKFTVTVNAPELPKATLRSISAVTLDPGKTATRKVTANPADAVLKVSASNTGVATAALSGNTVTVTAKGSGTATIIVIAEKQGYTSARATFKVTVSAPAPQVNVSKVQKVADSPYMGSTGIRIWLGNTTKPENYTVTVNGEPARFVGPYFECAVLSNSNLAKMTEAQLKALVKISPK